MKGVVAAGHPLTAEAGAQVLRAGGNAVDSALAAMVTSFVTEPQLTGLGAGGYMLVAEPGAEPALLDFFVAAPGQGADPSRRAPLVPAEVYFEAAAQVFHVGAASCGVYGTPAGICEAHRRYATVPLGELVAPAAAPGRPPPVGGAGPPGGVRRGAPPLRDRPARRARRAGRRPRARGRGAQRPAGLHLRAARADHGEHAGGAREVLDRRPRRARGRRA